MNQVEQVNQVKQVNQANQVNQEKQVNVKSSIGIITHKGHISKVNANAQLVSKLVLLKVTLITSRASCDAKK